MTHLLRREAAPRPPIGGQRATASRDPALRLDPRLLTFPNDL